MHIRFLIFLFLLSPFFSFSQKWDYQWPMGYDFNVPGETDISLLDFTGQQVQALPYAETNNLDFPNSGSFICDKDGQLLLLTNNCAVYDKNLQEVPGSDTLTPGENYNYNCNQFGFYPTGQSTLILPELTNDSTFYVLHKDGRVSGIFEDVISEHFYLSIIIRKPDNSLYFKEKRLLLDSLILPGRLSACLDQEGGKWWTWAVGYDTNKFYKFLIGGEEVVEGPFEQEVGDPLKGHDIGIGHAAFSPNAAMLGIHTDLHKAVLYDFDNATGELSNYRAIPYPDDGEYGRGLVFSPNSRFMYLTTVHNVYQVDLEDTSVVHIAFHESFDEGGWPVTTGFMYLGPDCRLYISPGSTTFYVHVIHRPNEKGMECQFQERALRMPSRLSHDFLNIPMYRFNGACDSTIQFPVVSSGAGAVGNGQVALNLWPNPASSYLTVSLPKVGGLAELAVMDVLGRQTLQLNLDKGEFQVELDVQDLPAGIYFLQYLEDGEVQAVERFVVTK